MDITDIIKESILYPLTDYQNWLIIAVICLLNQIILELITPTDFSLIGSIISLFISLVLGGYAVSVIRSTFNHQNTVPILNPVANVIDGVKNFIVNLVYMIIPSIITLIIAIPIGVYDYAYKFLYAINNASTSGQITASTDPNAILSFIPQDVINGLAGSIGLIVIIGFILFLIFAMLSQAGIGRLAETDNILAAINFVEAYNKISSIGIVKYIGTFILLIVVCIVLAIIGIILNYIPYIGLYLDALIISSYALLVSSRCIGLLYLEG